MLTTFAAAPQPTEGWGKLTGLLIAAAVGWLFVKGHQRWQQLHPTSSTEPPADTPGGVKPQVTACSDPTSDPTPGQGSGQGWEEATPLSQWARDRVGRGDYRATVRAGMIKFKKSEATIKRALRRYKNGSS
jgi:hypothetical protein